MVAVNIEPRSPLEKWVSLWKSTGAGDVLWGQDTDGSTVEDYRLLALGTEIIVDRQGSEIFRSDGAVGYKKLRSEVEKHLQKPTEAGGRTLLEGGVVMEVLFLVAVCCGLPVLVAIGMSLSKKTPKKANEW